MNGRAYTRICLTRITRITHRSSLTNTGRKCSKERKCYGKRSCPYYDLIVIKVTEGEASFNSELQNDPIDPEMTTFNEEWFDYYEPENMDFWDQRVFTDRSQ